MEAVMFRRLTLLAAFLLMTAALHAQTATNLAVGSVAAQWLDIAGSARIEGMGEAYVAVADDENALGVNPAGLGKIAGTEISLTHDAYIQNADIEQGKGSFTLGPGNVGVGLTYGNFGNVEQYTVNNGTPVDGGSYQPMVWKMDLGYGLSLMPDIYAGLSVKYLMDDITSTQLTGWAFDAGGLWTPKDTNFTVGLSVLNMGTLSGSAIPTEVRGGASYKLDITNDPQNSHTLLVSLDALARTVSLSSNREAVGFEYSYHDKLFLRVGQALTDTTGLSGWSGFSAGVGIEFDKIKIDYAYAQLADLGTINMISLATGL
jgi:hypothetical protein